MAAPLNYSPPPPLLQRRWPRRLFLVMLLPGVIGVAWRYGPDGLAIVDFRYAQRRCARYTAPADQVVFEEDPARAATLLRDDAYRPMQFLNRAHGAMALRTLDVWSRYLTARGVNADAYRDCAPLFLHELRAPGGVRRIVYVGYDYYHLHAGRSVIATAVNSPGDGVTPLNRPAEVFATFFPTHVLPRNLRFYAGQVDADDPSHFTIAFEWAGEQGRVHGWLQDDATLRYEVRVQRRQ